MYTHTLNLVPPVGSTLEIRIGIERGAVHVQDVDSGVTGSSPIAAHTDYDTPYNGPMISLALYDLMENMGYEESSNLCHCGCSSFEAALEELAEELLMPRLYPARSQETDDQVSVTTSLQTVFPGLSTWFDIEKNKIGPHEVRADSMIEYHWTFPWHVDIEQLDGFMSRSLVGRGYLEITSPCTVLDAYVCWCHMENQEGGS
tara:strand:+ start:1865 stop:2470 length:606 start_codon:yes stop_codon:yes gene_type:complete